MSGGGGRILIADDDAPLRRVTTLQLQKLGHEVREASNGKAALACAKESEFDLILSDLVMEGFTGLELLQHLRAEQTGAIVIIFTAFGTVENAVTAMKAGAWDYLTKPVHPDKLEVEVRRALQHLQLHREVVSLRGAIDRKFGFDNMIGQAPSLLSLLDMAIRIAPTDATVLIEGETGTGKELLARALHANSARTSGPFMTVNCAAIPRDLLESELFGHTKGSFTGAAANRTGKVELADGGTLFLDEIGELPLDMQAKMLRLVQQGEVETIGAGPARRVNVRIVAATNRDLEQMAKAGTFREDLYYRISVIPLRLPPLRERPTDIPVLAEHFFAKLRSKHNRTQLRLSDSVVGQLSMGYDWPGNVRELENVIERAVLLARGDTIEICDLPERLQVRPPTLGAIRLTFPSNGVSLDAVEKDLIREALVQAAGNQSAAARLLDITRKTLVWRMEKHGLTSPNGIKGRSDEPDES